MRFEKGFNLKREFAIAALVCAVFVGGTIWSLPPFTYISSWNDSLKDYWEATSAEPPVPHAEEWTLAELAERTGTSVAVITARFEAQGYAVTEPSQALKDIAAENGVSPNVLFALVSESKGAGENSKMRGSGLGRKTLAEYCEDQNIPLQDAVTRLRDAGIVADSGQRMKAIAEAAELSPGEIASIIAPSR
jgi:hypothetical protein